MELDVAALDGAREAWRSGRHAELGRASIDAVTLGACLEGACWAATADGNAARLLEGWSASSRILTQALRGLTTTMDLPRPGEHDSPRYELRRCPSRAELVEPSVGVEWRYFLDRFRRSLQTRLKLSPGTARGLAAALQEMVDNVVEHAGLGDEPRGLVAYEISEANLGLAVADLGRGVLASLRENPAHQGIATDQDAMCAAITGGASRRAGMGGTGFSDLMRALADLEGQLIFRSGSSRLILDGRGAGNRIARISNSPRMQGFQLSVTAQPNKSAW